MFFAELEIKPFVRPVEEFGYILVELGHLKIDEAEFFIKNLLRMGFDQHHVVHVFPGVFGRFIKFEIQNTDAIHWAQMIVPIAARGLVLNGKARIIDAPIDEVILLCLLKLYNELLAV